MDYEIFATLGPKSESRRIIRDLRAAGATGFRLNTSHLSLRGLTDWLERLTPLLRDADPPLPLVLDLQGSKWRLGRFRPFVLQEGEKVEIILAAATERINRLPVPHPDFFQAAPLSNGSIVLNDAKIRLGIESMEADRIITRTEQGGDIAPLKGITFSQSGYRKESLSKKDRQIFELTQKLSSVRYALSYVKDSREMDNFRVLLGDNAYLVAKLERESAVEEAMRIASSANELWLCRGDLGAEMGLRNMAAAVHTFSDWVRRSSVPVLLAGQVLEHMTEHPFPTRSEVSYLYDALSKGYRGVVLSDETALGGNPLEACRTAAMFR